ncbi:NUDIX domain-containing protein [Saccharopolyspora sp. SCSIO 74807]|uniref:NUDIX hydrolase n=1 Tax=Saccharopolyspora sp. SCSIO 74807 TaxID=3118084 RepID=UPI0030D5985C
MTEPGTDFLTAQDSRDGIQQQVVGAVINDSGAFLVLKRPADDFRGGTWELPSGKVEAGEDLLDALHREVTEETGLTIERVSGYLGAFDYLSGSGKHTRQHTWMVTVTSSEGVRLTEHDAYEWASTASEYPVSTEVRALLAKAEQND